MSSDYAIKVDNLSKCYQIYAKPQDRLKQALLPRLRKYCGLPHQQYFKDFWALRDVSFEVKKGETLGIIGRNGSGKSTLLQMICGTLNPTSGSIQTNGRIAALLELGSGFNPEFTGRENIFMNAAVLGLTHAETLAKYDDILAFADIGDFIHQQVKTYSSGMYVRLAFAVAINVEPDILIVDEALAVGDAGFQLKCALKMNNLQESGTTILFVSHDTNSVIRLCNRAILLESGSIKSLSNDVVHVVKLYESITRNIPTKLQQKDTTQNYHDELGGIHETRLGSREAEYQQVDCLDTQGNLKHIFDAGEKIIIKANIKSYRNIQKIVAGFSLKDKQGNDVWGDNTLYAGLKNISLVENNNYIISFSFDLHIKPGEYFLYIGLADITNERKELDQRWPVRKIIIVGSRESLGVVYSPAAVRIDSL